MKLKPLDVGVICHSFATSAKKPEKGSHALAFPTRPSMGEKMEHLGKAGNPLVYKFDLDSSS